MVSALGLVAITGIMGWQVFARYGLNAAPSWTEQAALYLMLWFILFVAAAGVREGFHIRLTMLQDSFAPLPRRVLRMVCHAIVGTFEVVMAFAGMRLVQETRTHTIATIGLPRGSAYTPLAVAGAHVHVHKVSSDIAGLRAPVRADATQTDRTREARFMGFPRPDGRVATRNYIGVLTSVNCSATVARKIAEAFPDALFEGRDDIHGVVALTHTTGCGMNAKGEGAEDPDTIGSRAHPVDSGGRGYGAGHCARS